MLVKRRSLMIGLPAAAAASLVASKSLAADCNAEEAATALITTLKISKFSPRARADLVAAVVNTWSTAVAAQIITPGRVQHFMAQIATETGGFARIDENLHYSASGLVKTFPKRVTPAEASRLEGHPEDIANKVYGNRADLGNDKPGDGWKYRGSGFIQLTGKANFKSRGDVLGLDLVGNPEIVRTPVPGFEAAISFWTYVKGNEKADTDNVLAVRKAINGGTNGLDAAKIWIARAKRVFTEVPTSPEEANTPDGNELRAVQSGMEDLGLIKKSPEEDFTPSALVAALQKFRADVGLPTLNVSGLPLAVQATSLYDEDVLYALTDPFGFVRTD